MEGIGPCAELTRGVRLVYTQICWVKSTSTNIAYCYHWWRKKCHENGYCKITSCEGGTGPGSILCDTWILHLAIRESDRGWNFISKGILFHIPIRGVR